MGPDRVGLVPAGEHDPVDAVRAQVLDLVLEERPVGDRQHRLGRRVREGAKARALAAHQDDRDHETASARSPASRSTPPDRPDGRPTRTRTRPPRAWRGSSRLRPSTMSGVAIASRTARLAHSCRNSPHSVTITAASAPVTASSSESASSTPSPSARAGVPHRDRVVADHVGALGPQARRQHQARRLAHVVGVGLERQPEQRDAAAAQRSQVPLELADDAPLLELVHLDHRRQELEVVAGVAGQLLQRLHVLRETATRRSRSPAAGSAGRCARRGPSPAPRPTRRRRPPRRRSRSR